jgi:anti-anti-sigma factor
MNHDSLTLRVRHEPGVRDHHRGREIDIFTVARLRDQLFTVAAGGHPLIADLDQVTFIGAARRAAARGSSLRVVCARPQTCQLLQLTGLDRTLRLARTPAEALQALPAASDPAARPARPPQPVPVPPGGDDDD